MQEGDHKYAMKPRKAFLLSSLFYCKHSKIEIILGMDANLDITSKDIEALCANTGVVQIAIHKRPHLTPLQTYDRGKIRCMEIILTSPKATEATNPMGY